MIAWIERIGRAAFRPLRNKHDSGPAVALREVLPQGAAGGGVERDLPLLAPFATTNTYHPAALAQFDIGKTQGADFADAQAGLHEQLHQGVIAARVTMTGTAGDAQQTMNFPLGETGGLAVSLRSDRFDRAGGVGAQPAVSLRPAAQATQRLQAPVHRRRPQPALRDQVSPVGDELAFAQRREFPRAGVPAQEQAHVLQVAGDRGGGEIGALQAGLEVGQPWRVGVRRPHRYFPQRHPPG